MPRRKSGQHRSYTMSVGLFSVLCFVLDSFLKREKEHEQGGGEGYEGSRRREECDRKIYIPYGILNE